LGQRRNVPASGISPISNYSPAAAAGASGLLAAAAAKGPAAATSPALGATAVYREALQQKVAADADNASDSSEERKANLETIDGAVMWDVVLKKRSEVDKFGFLQINGKLEFEARWAARTDGAGSSTNAPTPQVDGPNVLVIRKIHAGGLLERWNARHPDMAVRPHDRILSVNGLTTVDEMQRETRTCKIVLRCCRLEELFKVPLKKNNNQKLGLRFEKPQKGQFNEIIISEVLGDGLVAEYNLQQVKLQRWSHCILPGMVVEAVNDARGDATAIADELRTSEEVTLVINRDESQVVTQTQLRKRQAPPQ